jgi:NAD(P)-dependent dehydrogenase (short-subunit alcohol dehydrogenase family)
MSINADSVFLGHKHALPLIRESQPGSIVNLSSIAGLIASHNFAVYNASKAAVWLLTATAVWSRSAATFRRGAERVAAYAAAHLALIERPRRARQRRMTAVGRDGVMNEETSERVI